MAAERRNLDIDAGATFRLVIEYTDKDGVPVDLTGYTAQWQARTSVEADPPAITKTPLVSGSNITLHLTAAETAALAGVLVYAVEVHGPGGEPVVRILDGQITVSPEIVR